MERFTLLSFSQYYVFVFTEVCNWNSPSQFFYVIEILAFFFSTILTLLTVFAFLFFFRNLLIFLFFAKNCAFVMSFFIFANWHWDLLSCLIAEYQMRNENQRAGPGRNHQRRGLFRQWVSISLYLSLLYLVSSSLPSFFAKNLWKT